MIKASAVTQFDARPFFEKALAHGVQHKIIGKAALDAIRLDGPKGMVQIADYFGTAFLRANLEQARLRIVTLASLYLEDDSGGDLAKAAKSLRDNSFLSHSRGGSAMLKALHAMPKSTLFGDDGQEPIKDFLAEWSLYGTRILPTYREMLAQRQEVATSLAAAAWYAEQMGIARSTLGITAVDERYLTSAEGVIRTAILLRLSKEQDCPNRADFARLLMGLRSKPLPARAVKLLQTAPPALPPAYRTLEQSIAAQIVQFDLPKIADPELPLDALIHQLESRYFLRPTGIDDVSEFDAMVSAAWHKIMKGKTEPDARLTAFLCIAAGSPPKTSISVATARTLIRKIRGSGLDNAAVMTFINETAPFDLRESLTELWMQEFVPDAEVALFDARDDKLAAALKFLQENCRVTTPAPAKKSV